MLGIKNLKDFHIEEIKKFEEMHEILTTYNAKLGTPEELPIPNYSRNEMAEYSGYRELLIVRECED